MTEFKPTQYCFRADGRVEFICEHGIGHTIFNPRDEGKWTYSHGCDGCCEGVSELSVEGELK